MEDNGRKTWYDGSMKKGKDPRGGLRRGFSFSRLLRFYEVRLLTDGLRRRNIGVSRYHGTLCGTYDLRWPYLSLHDERYGRKACLVVASSTSFVLPLVAKAQSLRCSSFPHRTHFVGLRRGPIFKLLPRTRLYCNTCDKNVGTLRITCLIYSRQSGGCVNLSFLLGTRSTQRQGDKRSAAADLIASNAPLRGGRHKARPAYTKPLTPGDSRGSQSPWHAFLLYLSPCSERWSPRRVLEKQSGR